MTGWIRIGRNVHISTGACLLGVHGVEIGDYSAISAGVKLFTATEDLSGEWLCNPQSPANKRRPIQSYVRVGKHCVIGANSVVLPGAEFPDGACLGALSLAKKPLQSWSIYAGVPARFIRARSRRALELE
jgi:galactoside O-acetyltransferase